MRVCFFIICPLEQGYSLHSISWVIFPYRCTNQTITYTYIMHVRIQEFWSVGVHVSQTKTKLWQRFFVVLSLYYRSQKVNFKGIYHFSRFKRGSNIFQGGGGVPTFSRGGGSNCIFPIETHITCDFPGGGGVRTPCPPSGSALACNYHFVIPMVAMRMVDTTKPSLVKMVITAFP